MKKEMIVRNIFILFSLVLVQGCTITQVVEPVEMSKGNEICIIESSAVRPSFLEELKNVLSRKGIQYRVVHENTSINDCEWSVTYVGRWSWDLALYMSYAEIKVFHNGVLDGKAVYDSTSGGATMGKFIDADEKIQELVEELIQMRTSAFNYISEFG